MASKKTSTKQKAPWKKPAPKKANHSSLSPAQKKHAKARAKKAGRSYPNLVDNMHEAASSGGASKKATKRKSAAKKKAPAKAKTATKRPPSKKKSTKRAPAKKKASKRAPAKKKASKRAPAKGKAARASATSRRAAPSKDPKGGLTAAGRRMFHERDGSNLKPGVMKPVSQMTTAEMKRKGSWAVRFYGRSGALPPLTDAHGKPTRLALTAAAWGEPVPKTVSQARAIAAKGHKLLERARAAEG